MTRLGFVYFLEAIGADAIKIGWTECPLRRRIHHQISSPLELQFLAIAPGTLADEGALQRRFALDCVRGEWYRKSNALMALIADICRLGEIPGDVLVFESKRTGGYASAASVIAKFGGTGPFAEAIGAHRPTVNRWRLRGFIHPRWFAKILAAAKTKNIPISIEELLPMGVGEAI